MCVVRTVGAVKSRWFREIKPWRESEPAHVVNKKVQEGKRLAFEKYKSFSGPISCWTVSVF